MLNFLPVWLQLQSSATVHTALDGSSWSRRVFQGPPPSHVDTLGVPVFGWGRHNGCQPSTVHR